MFLEILVNGTENQLPRQLSELRQNWLSYLDGGFYAQSLEFPKVRVLDLVTMLFLPVKVTFIP